MLTYIAVIGFVSLSGLTEAGEATVGIIQSYTYQLGSKPESAILLMGGSCATTFGLSLSIGSNFDGKSGGTVPLTNS